MLQSMWNHPWPPNWRRCRRHTRPTWRAARNRRHAVALPGTSLVPVEGRRMADRDFGIPASISDLPPSPYLSPICDRGLPQHAATGNSMLRRFQTPVGMKEMTRPMPHDIAARLDRLPSSRTVWTIIVLLSLGSVFEFYDLFFAAYVAPGMAQTGLFTPGSLGIFASLKVIQVAGFGTFVFSTFAGLWFGVVILAQASDRFG